MKVQSQYISTIEILELCCDQFKSKKKSAISDLRSYGGKTERNQVCRWSRPKVSGCQSAFSTSLHIKLSVIEISSMNITIIRSTYFKSFYQPQAVLLKLQKENKSSQFLTHNFCLLIIFIHFNFHSFDVIYIQSI